MNKYLFTFILATTVLIACQKNEVLKTEDYACDLPIVDPSLTHPKAATYQGILDKNAKNGMVGAILLVKDKEGLWMGASGQADIASNVPMKSCNTFLIASISKVFTAAAVYRYADKGLLSTDDLISKWLPTEMIDKIDNAKEAKISHLLSHTSGIHDFYTNRFELDRTNKVFNEWDKEKVVTYIYGKKANFEVGSSYAYSNTNYLLLSIILEKVSGKSFEQVYQEEIFSPLNLSSAYYSETDPIPAGCVKGYSDFTADGNLIDSQHLYQDELGIGGDGGIAINAYDLAVFLEELMKGNLISDSSLEEMTNWFDMPEDWHWKTYGQNENGFGLEKFNTDYGYAVGHTGGIDGFSSFGFYFPDEDMTYILFVNNTKAFDTAKKAIFEEVMSLMFD
ncbi:MAG: beta-lactamase family protein [Flavobacteriales bacterium]|nr:beta-lactamase family protein [Flavobacteriales bacterium]